MNTSLIKATLTSMCVGAFTTALAAPAAFCEGSLEAGSEASVSAGFPVLTGPGATVLTPEGSYVVDSTAVRRPGLLPTKVAASRRVECQVKNYYWGPKTHHRVIVKNEQLSTTRRSMY